MKKTGITLMDEYDNTLTINLDSDGDVSIETGNSPFSFKNEVDLELFNKNVLELLNSRKKV